jgi:hypothetical protein
MIPPRHYIIESNGKRELYLTWDALSWKNFEVQLDGKQVSFMENGAAALKNGHEIKLPGGASLTLQLKGIFPLRDIHVHVNDQPIPNTVADPEVKIRRATNALYFMALLDIVLGIIAVQSGNPALTTLGFGWTTVAIGMVLFSLALLVRKASLIALILAIGLYLLDVLLAAYVANLSGIALETGVIVARLFLLVSMFPAIPAIRSLNNNSN